MDITRRGELDVALAQTLVKYEERARRILPYVKESEIAEFGCGLDVVLSLLSKSFPESFIVGVDLSDTMLDLANQRDLGNVILIKGDVCDRIFPEHSFDTVIFVSVLHGIHSFKGNVMDALANASGSLKPGGKLIVVDFVRPEPRLIKIELRNKDGFIRLNLSHGPK